MTNLHTPDLRHTPDTAVDRRLTFVKAPSLAVRADPPSRRGPPQRDTPRTAIDALRVAMVRKAPLDTYR